MRLKGSRVILTGGAGFIGNNTIELLASLNVADLVVIDKMGYASDSYMCKKHKVTLIEKDINDVTSTNFIKAWQPHVVINMAAESHVDNSIRDPELFLRSNVQGTVRLLDVCRGQRIMPLFVQISTDEVYGDIERGLSVEEDARVCSSPYSASKGAAELFVESYGRTYGLPYLITRSSNNYGSFQDKEKFIPTCIRSLLQGKPIPLYGDGLQERDWIHVSDNVKGLFAAIENGKPNSVYNIGAGAPTTNYQIAHTLCTLMDKDPEEYISYVTDRPGHDRRYALSAHRLQFLGWKQEVQLLDGLKSTIEWYRNK